MRKNILKEVSKIALVVAMVATLTACGEEEVVVTPNSVITEKEVIEDPVVVEPVEEVQNEGSEADFSFSDTEDGSGVILTDYSGISSVVTVPDTHNGKPVVALGGSSFSVNETLEEVILPESVISIENGAFSQSSIQRITLSPLTEYIGDDAFFMCYELESMDLPDTITFIGEGAFSSSGIKEVNIPNQIDILLMSTFAGTPLEKIVIPGTIKEIEERVFESCSKLKEIEIQEGVETIGKYVFTTGGETLITVPASVTSINDTGNYENYISFIVEAGSYGEEYAKQWELNYTVK